MELNAEGHYAVENLEKEVIKPVGDVILGEKNPAELSKEEFENSPDILYHGASSKFEFSRTYDYSGISNSHTIGKAFYATDSKAEAEVFSKARYRKDGSDGLVVVKVLPYRARMLDFRDIENKSSNAPVPKDLFNGYVKWLEGKFNEQYKDYNPDIDEIFLSEHPQPREFMVIPLGRVVDEESRRNKDPYYDQRKISRKRIELHLRFKQYISRLKNLSPNNTDLRIMLSSTGDPVNSEYSADKFPAFMREIGYDGVIYIEGGDHPDNHNPVSYAFYNLDKIGDYDTWHNNKNNFER